MQENISKLEKKVGLIRAALIFVSVLYVSSACFHSIETFSWADYTMLTLLVATMCTAFVLVTYQTRLYTAVCKAEIAKIPVD